MTRKKTGLATAFAFALAIPSSALAADHSDAPAVIADPASDITDQFSWMSSDGNNLLMALNIPAPAADTQFSDAIQYVFHIRSQPAYGDVTGAVSSMVLCTFDDASAFQCWAGPMDSTAEADQTYVTGTVGDAQGAMSANADLRVFAGQRNDPFFFNAAGFTAVVATAAGAAPNLMFNPAGCPTLDAATSGVLVGQLAAEVGGAAALDDFAGANILALVVSIDKTLVNGGGDIISVWTSTRRQ